MFKIEVNGLYKELRVKGRFIRGKNRRNKILANRAITPNSLLGIDLRIA